MRTHVENTMGHPPTATKRAEMQREKEHAQKYLEDVIQVDTLIHTRVQYGRGERDYVKVYIVKQEPDEAVMTEDNKVNYWRDGRQGIIDITYYVARAGDFRLRHGGCVLGGGQYDKGLEVAEKVWKLRFGPDASVQKDNAWREIR